MLHPQEDIRLMLSMLFVIFMGYEPLSELLCFKLFILSNAKTQAGYIIGFGLLNHLEILELHVFRCDCGCLRSLISLAHLRVLWPSLK